MTKSLDLDGLVPEDIEIHYREQTYLIPGDMDTDTMWRLLDVFQGLEKKTGVGSLELQKKALKRGEAEVLALVQMRQPEVEQLPFGLVGLQHVLSAVLEAIGVAVEQRSEDPNPPPKPKMAIPKAKKHPPSKSRRSPGSRRL
jgi:hypothetical protein